MKSLLPRAGRVATCLALCLLILGGLAIPTSVALGDDPGEFGGGIGGCNCASHCNDPNNPCGGTDCAGYCNVRDATCTGTQQCNCSCDKFGGTVCVCR